MVNFALILAKESMDNALDFLVTHNVPLHVTVRVLLGKNDMRMEWTK